MQIARDTAEQNPAPPDGIKIVDLIHQLHTAASRMSRKNEHRALILQAMSTIMQLSAMIPEPKPEPPRIVRTDAFGVIQ